MIRKPLHTSLATLCVIILFAGAFFTRCASIGNPTGGPRDSIPPVVLGTMPELYTTQFDNDKIYITFNEYVQIKEQQKELYTSPQMKKLPKLLLRGKSLVVELVKDSLAPNTTYAIEFGASIADNNEGNPLHGLRYVFSTGESIDSMLMSGYTEDSHKGDSLGRAFIYFFEVDSIEKPESYDSTMFKYKPSKIARSQKNGIFIAQNLKPVNYRVYAIGDKNDNQLYEPGTDMVGLLDTVYNPATMPEFAIWFDSLRMYPTAEPQLYFRMFTDKAFVNQRLVDAQRPEQKKAVLYFNADYPRIDSLVFDNIPSDKVLIDPQTNGRDTMVLWFNVPAEELPDTIKGKIVYFRHDSVRQLSKTREPLKLAWTLVETKEQQKERERIEKEKKKAEEEGREWIEPEGPSTFKFENLSKNIEVIPEENMTLNFATPLTRFDSTSFSLISWGEQKDTLQEKIIFIPDSISPRKWFLRSNWKKERKYKLHIPTDALADITGEGNDSLDINIDVADIDKFATLILDIKPVTAGDEYILQITDERGKTVRELQHIGAGVHTINYIPAQDLKMRIIEDKNRNGRWDGGNMVERRQSERAEFYKNDQEEELFTTKTGWEFEFTLDMNRLFAPITMEQLIERLDKREMQRLIKLEEERKKALLNQKNEQHNHNNSSGMFGGSGGMGGMGGMLRNAGGMF